MADEFGLTQNENFVDVHGREISTTTIGRKNEEVCLLSDLKQTGVAIFRKSQFAKLSTINKDFGTDFVDFMLEQAKSYMLANRISFSQEQIKNSIENAKQVLTDNNKVPVHVEKQFLKDRKIETGSDDEIHIRVSSSTNQTKSPSPLKQKSPALKKFHLNSPRQPPVGKETDSGSDIENKSRKQGLQKKFPKKGIFVERDAESDRENKRRGSGQGADASKPRQPKSQQNKKFSYNITLKEHDVMVTNIDKRNCVWVRDLANKSLFEQIHKKVNEEAKSQRPAPKPWQLEKVYMAKDENVWFRCKIVRFSPLTVFFLDYGNIATVEEIKNVSEELAKTPCMAVRITFKEAQYNPRLEEEIRIKPFVQNQDGTFFVNVLQDKTNPAVPIFETPTFTGNGLQVDEEKPVRQNDDDDWDDVGKDDKSQNLSKCEEPNFFEKPPNLCSVLHDQRVVIVAEKNGEFFLRTKECFEKLGEIEKAIAEYVKTAKVIGNVEKDQLVLYEDKYSGKVYRAVLSKVGKNKVEIDFLDYPESVAVDLGTVKSINEWLSNEPITYFSGGKLLGFEEGPLDDNAKTIVQQCIKKRQKYTVVLGFDDELDLFDGSRLLSEQLRKSEKSPKRILLKDMKTFTPETGVRPYLCGCYKNSKYFSLVPSDDLQQHIDYVLRSEIDDDLPYTPVEGEICLCFYVDNWYRCVVTRVFDKEYEVLLLDFGNIELMKKEDLRKPDADIAKIPVLALPCVLIDLPQHHKVEDLLRKMLIEGELYNADVKRMSEGKWQVEIPSVYKRIRENIL